MVKNMTEGKPLLLLVSYAIPLLLGNLFQQLYNIVDSVVVGRHLGAMSLAAVGVSSSVQFLILGFCSGACIGMGIPIAQRFGAGDHQKMRDYIFQGSLITAALALVIATACSVFCPQILHLLQTPDSIYDNAYRYLLILFLGIPFSMLYNYTATILRSVGDSRTPFIFLCISTVLNIVLDILFIIVFDFGCAGAGLATITAQAVSGILCLVFILKKFEILRLKPENLKVRGRDIGTMVVMGIPMGLQFSITAIGSMALQSSNNALGDLYVSGFTAANRLKTLAMSPFDAIATAVATFSSQNLGAGKFNRIRKGIRQGVTIAVVYGACAGIVLMLFGSQLTQIFVKSTETQVIACAALYLRRIGIFYFLLGFLNVYRMTVQGLGFALQSMGAGILEMFARCFVAFLFVPKFAFDAVCFADPCAWFAAVVYVLPLLYIQLGRLERKFKSEI